MMRSTRAPLSIVLVVSSFALAGCGHSEAPPPATPTAQASPPTPEQAAPAEHASATHTQVSTPAKKPLAVAKHVGNSKTHAKSTKKAKTHAQHASKAAKKPSASTTTPS